ncbi:ribosome maturation factor RimP [[Clostridium] polysaccharolyticum]|uniref:Ribosome maturation factor RimP n=1 Tax=[Clostridium] polysaccharolyticum TaxID=29364 RepID=A0A1I0AHZ8_9FIRM|nr:ribosome maturation factor RimP [[Clostridium] polysaccharolyticum]SES93929.1 ribosome maturation factor RimP [[Clostridium] polysaccharolyticum]
MSKKEDYEKRAEALIEPIVAKNQFELVDVEYVKEGSNWFLRAFIDKPGGITVDDCELVSREFSDLLDKEDFIEDSYIMEVSSPGLGRQLKKDKDLKRSIGEEVEIKLYKGIKQMRKNKEVSVKEFSGFLTAFDESTVTIELEDESAMELQRKDIAMIRLAIPF